MRGNVLVLMFVLCVVVVRESQSACYGRRVYPTVVQRVRLGYPCREGCGCTSCVPCSFVPSTCGCGGGCGCGDGCGCGCGGGCGNSCGCNTGPFRDCPDDDGCKCSSCSCTTDNAVCKCFACLNKDKKDSDCGCGCGCGGGCGCGCGFYYPEVEYPVTIIDSIAPYWVGSCVC